MQSRWATREIQRLFNKEKKLILEDFALEEKQFSNEFNEITITRECNKLLCAEICRATKKSRRPAAYTKLYLDVPN